MKYRRDGKSKPIPVLLDQVLRDRIDDISERMGEPKSTVMRIAMRIGLDNLEKAFENKPAKPASPNYPPPSPQHAELNQPSSDSKKDTQDTAGEDTKFLDKQAVEAVRRGKKRREGPK